MTTIKPSEAMTITPTPTKEYFGLFLPSFRENVHRLIHRGYEDARCRIQHPENKKDEEEPSITGFLAEAIKDRLNAFDPDDDWYKQYSVHDDPPIGTEGRSGKYRSRADLIIESTSKGRPEYVFEAKRLKKRVSDYTDSDGMGCFISGRYASRYNEAGMLGYVQSDSLEEWKGKVKGKIDQDAEKLNLINGTQRDKQVIDAFPTEWVSEHNRNSLRPITLYHILLDCCVE